MVVRVISMRWSSIMAVSREKISPSARPTAAPPATTMKNFHSPVERPASPPRIISRRMLKMTTAAPSLKRLSPSTMLLRRRLTPISRKRAITEIGSVALIIEPKRKATGSVSSRICAAEA
jgi:hypothetical protein